MISKPLGPFVTVKTRFVNETSTSLSPLKIPMKPILVSAKKVASRKATVQANQKRKIDTNGSEGPLKKRHIVNMPATSTYVNRQLCSSKKIEEHFRALLLIQSLNKTIPYFLGAHQLCPALVNNVHVSNIHDSQHHKLNLKTMNKLFYFESTTSSKDLYTLPIKKACITRQTSFGNDATQSRQESGLKNCLHVFENKLPTVNKQLSLIQDKNNLSELQCFIRENIELFTATEQDESTYFR